MDLGRGMNLEIEPGSSWSCAPILISFVGIRHIVHRASASKHHVVYAVGGVVSVACVGRYSEETSVI